MKKKFILLPITLTAIAPMISMVGCGNPDTPEEHKVKVDPSSDTTDINISTPEITLNQELVIPYEVTNPEKELDVDSSWLKFDSSQYPLSNTEFSYDNSKVIIPTNKVATYNITICLKSKPKVDITKELDQNKTVDAPKTETTTFVIELNKNYRFNVNAGICEPESFEYCDNVATFFVYKDNDPDLGVDILISRVKVGENIFEPVEEMADLAFGKYYYQNKSKKLFIHNGSVVDSSFTMSVDLKFVGNEGEGAIARWFGAT